MVDAENFETAPFEQIIETFTARRILVVGDLMLDRFSYGQVGRISPEAPAAVIQVDKVDEIAGGAGNVATNIASMGGHCDLLAGIGCDEAAIALSNLIGQCCGIDPHLIHLSDRPTTVKNRYVAHLHNTHLLRADVEKAVPITSDVEDKVIAAAAALIPKNDAILLSDYGKGFLTVRVVQAIIDLAQQAGKLIIVDPKGGRYDRYRGASFITPNLSELRQATSLPLESDLEQIAAAETLARELNCRGMLVTRGENGVVLVERDAPYAMFSATARRVVDVSGAGDTLVAAFSLALVSGASTENSARLANVAAGLLVGKEGTSSISRAELRSALLSRPSINFVTKICSSSDGARQLVSTWKADGLVVGFTNGCFDLIHEGHVELLAHARSNCDRLVVALNSDASIGRLKGSARPIQNEKARAKIMAGFSFVDAVICFSERTPLQLIAELRPHVLIKGADYAIDEVVGRAVVEQYGGRVVLVPLIANSSTTGIVEKMKSSPQSITLGLGQQRGLQPN